MDMNVIEPMAVDKLADTCNMKIRLLYSIAISVKRLADLAEKQDKEDREDRYNTRHKNRK